MILSIVTENFHGTYVDPVQFLQQENPVLFSNVNSWNPSISGISRSDRIKSGWASQARSNAVRAWVVVKICRGAFSSIATHFSKVGRWSSTIKSVAKGDVISITLRLEQAMQSLFCRSQKTPISSMLHRWESDDIYPKGIFLYFCLRKFRPLRHSKADIKWSCLKHL